MQRNTPISRVMTRDPESIKPEDNLERVRQIFEIHGFHHVPVLEHGKLVGIVSYNDYLQKIRDLVNGATGKTNVEDLLRGVLVKDMMTPEVFTLQQDDTLETAVQIFHTHQFHALPVIDPERHLVGILTTNDLMRVLEVMIAPEKSYVEDGNDG